jgi:hypothetical protein
VVLSICVTANSEPLLTGGFQLPSLVAESRDWSTLGKLEEQVPSSAEELCQVLFLAHTS